MGELGEKILPRVGERNVLVTSALPYVNNYPHLGNIIGAVLSADVYTRFLRQRQVNVLYICGTDEYGTATETKAQQEGLSPREICDKYHRLHKEVYDWFDIAFDEFGRTSTEKQTEIVQEIFWDVYNNGYISENSMQQLYCEATCKRFLADRYVHGSCPICGYDDARGDQCDNCDHMLNPAELLNPRCATCDKPPEIRSTQHLFLDLPKLQETLEGWKKLTSVEGKWSHNALKMTDTWLRDGLKQRCITRDLKWGVPVPLEGYRDKVFYVWFDAPIGYVSITAAACGDAWRDWWIPEEDSKYEIDLVQFMGKDNVPFHTIVFPSSLLGTKKPWTKLNKISTSEYLNYEGGKFSKSRGIGVFGNDAANTGIPPEVWRYYLLINRPEGSDSAFTWADLAAKNNDELINNLGNFINRTVTFLFKFFDGIVPELLDNDPENREYIANVNSKLKEFIEFMEKINLKSGLKKAMEISSIGNSYLQQKAPWKLLKEGNKVAAGNALAFAANLSVLVAILVEPFLGTKFTQKVFSQFGLTRVPGVNNVIPDKFSPSQWLKAGAKTNAAVILFSALEPARVTEFKRKFAGDQSNDTTKAEAVQDATAFSLDLRVGNIVEITEHSESERLFVSKVDVGEASGPRTIVAGLREAYKADELLNTKVVVVCNLQPATLAGVNSEGMILCAEKKKAIKALTVDHSLSPGDQIVPSGMSFSSSDTKLDRKGFQAASKPLRVGPNDVVLFEKKYKLVAVSNELLAVTAQGVPEGGKIK